MMTNGNPPTPPFPPRTPVPWLAEFIAMIITVAFIATLSIALLELGSIDTKFNQAKDLLQIAVNLLGVIIGYYFGARPAQAIAAAADARAEEAKGTAREAAGIAIQIANRASTASTSGGGVPSDDLAKLNQLLGRLR